jgi:CRISPR-associated protein Cas1
MPTLVVAMQGALVRCAGGQVLVEHEGTVQQRLPQEQVERLLLLGRVGLTTGFIDYALAARIPVTFLTQDGAFKGRLDPGGRRDVALRLAQFQGLQDLPWRLGVASAIVQAKIAAQRGLLLRCHRNGLRPELAAAAAALDEAAVAAQGATTLPGLMGCEGRAARAYFGALPAALRRPFPLRGRRRRPPRDAGNALLSLGYGLLTAEALGALAGVGLDPQIGIFHSPRGRVPALAEDLVELFRAPVVDALMLSLVNLGVLREEHFTPTESGGLILTRPALAVYFRQYRRRMQAGFRDRDGQPTSFRRALQSQAAHLRRVILREETYEPFLAPMGGPHRAAPLTR